MRVSSDKQTLILAGEPIPPRANDAQADSSLSPMGSQLKRVTMLVVQEEYAAAPRVVRVDSIPAESGPALAASADAVDAPSVPAQFLVPYHAYSRGLSAGAAEYARTQNLSGGRTLPIIDTYA